MEQIGQHESYGDIRVAYECWNCDYSEEAEQWSRPLGTDGPSLMRKIADRLRGVEIPLRKDTDV